MESHFPRKSKSIGSFVETNPNISTIPTEIVDGIITLIISNAAPVFLEYLMERASSLTERNLFIPPRGKSKLYESQMAHQRDWVLVNSVCRAWRHTGQQAFFTQKSFIITTSAMQSLLAGRPKFLTSSSRPHLNILENIRHVIAPMPTCSAASNFLILPRYHAFSNLQSLDILINAPKSDILHDYCTSRYWSFPTGTEPDRELMECLAAIGLRINEIDIRFPCRAERMREPDMQRLRRDVFPYLQFVGAQKANRKA